MSLAAFRPTVHPFSSRGMLLFHAVGCVLMLSPMGFRIRIALIVECKPDYKKIILQSRQSYQYLKCQWKLYHTFMLINVTSSTSAHVVIGRRNGKLSTYIPATNGRRTRHTHAPQAANPLMRFKLWPSQSHTSIKLTAPQKSRQFAYLSDVLCCILAQVCVSCCVFACAVVGGNPFLLILSCRCSQ